MVVTPGEERVALDSLSRIRNLYPGKDIYVLINGERKIASGFEKRLRKLDVLLKKRKQPASWFKLYTTFSELFSFVLLNGAYDYIIKLDWDAILISRKVTQRMNRIFSKPKAGICGNYKWTFTGEIRNPHQIQNLYMRASKVLKEVKRTRSLNGNIWTIKTWSPFWWELRRSLKKQNYISGEHVAGGIYGLRFSFLKDLDKMNWLGKEELLALRGFPDDKTFSMLAIACGYQLKDIARPPHKFAVLWKQKDLEGQISVNEAPQYWALHPVKSLDHPFRKVTR